MNVLKTAIRIIFSVGLLAYLVYSADVQKIVETLSAIWTTGSTIYLVGAFVLFTVAMLVFSLRWRLLLRSSNIDIPLGRLYQYYLIGLFFNNFLPTGIGGDVARIYNVIRDSNERTISFASVLTERLVGICGTLLLTLIALLFLLEEMHSSTLLTIDILLITAIAVFFAVISSNRIITPLSEFIAKITILRLGERINKFIEALRHYETNFSVLVKVLALSLIGQTIVISMTWMCAKALQLPISPGYLFMVVPVTFLLTMIPSINGIGVRDGGYVFLLSKIGISSASALSLSFLAIFIPMILSLIGGLLLIMQKRSIKMEELSIAKDSI